MTAPASQFFQVKGFNQGQVIFREGQEGSYACIVNSGEVDVFKEVEGKPVRLARLGRGAVFGEMALIGDEKRTASVVAATFTEVVVLERQRFRHTLESSNPLVQSVIRGLVERLAHTNAMLHACPEPQDRIMALAHLIEALAEGATSDDSGRARLDYRRLAEHALKILRLAGKELEKFVQQMLGLGPLVLEHGPQGRELALEMPSKLSIKLGNQLARSDEPPLIVAMEPADEDEATGQAPASPSFALDDEPEPGR